jgi:hypothetical protein
MVVSRRVTAISLTLMRRAMGISREATTAAVYRSRLDRKMAMQADPTVVYALGQAGT